MSERDRLTKEPDVLPRGYIRNRVIRSRIYYYLQYRDGASVMSRYVPSEEKTSLESELNRRKEINGRLKQLYRKTAAYEKLPGIKTEYRPVRNVDYKEYTLFMSAVAHDYRRLTFPEFITKYDVTKQRGICRRYLKGFPDYIPGTERPVTGKSRDIVLDPYTCRMFFEYGQKDVLQEEEQPPLPAFLNQGLPVTEV